jgi:hypothetical protein
MLELPLQRPELASFKLPRILSLLHSNGVFAASPGFAVIWGLIKHVHHSLHAAQVFQCIVSRPVPRTVAPLIPASLFCMPEQFMVVSQFGSP